MVVFFYKLSSADLSEVQYNYVEMVYKVFCGSGGRFLKYEKITQLMS